MAKHIEFCVVLMIIVGTMAATRAGGVAVNADEAGDDIRAADRSRVVDMCRALLPGEPLGKEPLVLLNKDDYVLGEWRVLAMMGNWSSVNTGKEAGEEGSLATNPSSRQAGKGRQGAAVRRHVLLEGASNSSAAEGGVTGSSRAQGEGPPALSQTWGLSMQQHWWRSPNVGWVSGKVTLQGVTSAQLATLGLLAAMEQRLKEEEGAIKQGPGPPDLELAFVGLIFPQGEAPGGNLCLLGCLPPQLDLGHSNLTGPRRRAFLRRRHRLRPLGHGLEETAMFQRSYLDSGNCTIELQLHYTAPKVSLRGHEDKSLWGSLRPMSQSKDKPYLILSSNPPAATGERFHALYAPTIATQASEVCNNSKFMNSTRPSFLAKFVGPLFGWPYPMAEELGFTAKHVQGAGDERSDEPGSYGLTGRLRFYQLSTSRRGVLPFDWLQDPDLGTELGVRSLLATVLCTSTRTEVRLQDGKSVAEVNMNLLPSHAYQRNHCLRDGWVNHTAPADQLSMLHRLYRPAEGREPQTVALMLSLLEPVIMRTNGTAVFGALVGEGTYHPRTGKLCLLACLVSDKAARRFEHTYGSMAARVSASTFSLSEELDVANPALEGGAPAAAPEAPEEDLPLDCEISVTIQYPKFQPWPLTGMRAPLTGRVESLRELQDGEYFAPHEFIAPSYMSGGESWSAMEGREARLACSALVSSLAIVLVLLQTRHLKKHPAAGGRVSLYFVAMQIAGTALVLLAALLQATGDVWQVLLPLGSGAAMELTLGVVLLLAYARLFMRVRRARARSGRGLTPEEEGSGLELLLSKAREQRELKDLEGGGRPSQAPEEEAQAAAAPPPTQAADGEVAGSAGALAAHERTAFLLCIPVYLILLLYGLLNAASREEQRHSGGWNTAWSLLLYRCRFMGESGPGFGGSYSCLLGFALGPIGYCIRDLVLIPQLAFAMLYSPPDEEPPPLAHSYAYGILLCQLATHGLVLNQHTSDSSTHIPAGGALCLLLQLIYYRVLCDRRGKGKKEIGAQPADLGTG